MLSEQLHILNNGAAVDDLDDNPNTTPFYYIGNPPEGLNYTIAGVITGTVGYENTSGFTLTSVLFSVWDGGVNHVETQVWGITNTNRSPEVSAIGIQTNAEGEEINLAGQKTGA